MTHAMHIAPGRRGRWLRVLSSSAAAALIAAACQAAAAAPAAGDAYVYRLVNGYNKETRGQLRHQVEKVESNSITESVNPDSAEAGAVRTEIYTREGNWLRHEVESHGSQVEYAFTTPYPAYAFPLDPGKSWSVRVNATVPGGERRSVRVDGKVLGQERIRVPAGEFDTVKVRRFVYPGDPFFTKTETHITEIDWYAPALGRPVKTERRSDWLDTSQCGMDNGCDFRGNWDIYELVEAPRAAKR